MKKTILAVIAVLTFSLGLSACGSDSDTTSSIPKLDNTAASTDGTNPAKPVQSTNTESNADAAKKQ